MTQLSKILFLFSLATGTIISISSLNWLGVWMGLEINLLSFIPLMTEWKNMYSKESAIKYFITQAMASAILLFAVILLFISLNWTLSFYSPLIIMLNSSLLTKMGAAPFHFWFPEVMEGLNWMNCMILLTWQKLAPMVLLIYSNKPISFMFFVIFSCMVVSGVMGQNQLSMRKIMAYSSINHIGWMIASSLFLETIWMFYYLIYVIISVNIMILFKIFNIFFLKQLFSLMKSDFQLKMFFIMNFLSLGGLPPFLGFFPKWLTIQVLAYENFHMLAIFMILATLLTLFFYIRVMYSTILVSMSTPVTSFDVKETKFLVLSFNFVTLLSLILCTLTFNFL